MEIQFGSYTESKPFAPEFIQESGTEEDKLWLAALNRNMMHGFQFNRQVPVCQYVVDFLCHKLHLIIEIDGTFHTLKSKSVHKKLDDLEMLGYLVLIFSETDVAYHLDTVIDTISHTMELQVKRMVLN